MEPEPVSRRLAEFAASVRPANVPAEVFGDASRAVLDWIGSALAGSVQLPAVKLREVTRTLGTSDEATVFAGGRASAAVAALANGVATHILEYDDVHKGSTLHAAAPVIPAALAVAEREFASGEDFLVAVTLGYEAALRIGEAVNPSHYRFWHPTGTAATFGAAVAAGYLLRLDAGQMLDALGNAGTQAAGLWEFNADGAMSKALHPGKAAMNGVLSADLARQGFTAATRILEGERGFFRATSAEYDASRITEALGTRWKVQENCFKIHACCGHTHSAIDVALEHRAALGWTGAEAADAIAAVEIETYAPGLAIVKERNPATPTQAKFSLAYVVATALLEGRVGLSQFSDDRFSEAGVVQPAIASLIPRIRIEATNELTKKYPDEWGTRVTFVGRDGSRTVRAAAFPRGNPENPVSTALLEDKLRSLVFPRWGPDVAEQAIDAVRRLREAPSMTSVFADFGSLTSQYNFVHG